MALATRAPRLPGWSQWLDRRRQPAGEQRAGTQTSSEMWSGMAADVPQWAEDDYLSFTKEGYGRNELVFACIKQIATSASEARIRPITIRNGQIEEITDTPLAQLLKRPDKRKTQYELKELHHTSQQIAGNTYIFKLRGQMSQVLGLRVLPPHRVRVVPGHNGEPMGYLYKLDGVDYPIAPEDLIHIKSANLGNDWYGLSPLHVLAKRVNLDASLITFQSAFFRNGGIPAGILKFKRELDEEEPEIFRRQWRQRFGGSKAWDIAVFGDSMDYQQVSIDLDKMMMPDLSAITEARICLAFQVPPILVGAMVGLAHATYSNYGQAFEAFWYGTIQPENRRLMDALELGLEDDFPGDWSIDADVSQVRALQEDEDKRAARWALVFEKGGCSRNEFRAGIDLDALDGDAGDAYRIPQGVFELTADELAAGGAGQMDTLFEKGIAFLGETRGAFSLEKKQGDDVRVLKRGAIEQSEEELANHETPIQAPAFTMGITGPTVNSLPTSIQALFPDDAVAAPKPPPVLPFGGPSLPGEPPKLPEPHPGAIAALPEGTPKPEGDAVRSLVPALEQRARTPRQTRYMDALATLRTQHTATAEQELTGYFKGLASRAAGIVGRARSLYGLEVREPSFTPDDLVPKSADGQLAAILRRIAAQTAEAVWQATNESGLVGDVDWDASLPSVTKLLTQAAGRALEINNVTRDQLKQVLAAGYERGYTIKQIADGVPDEGYPGVKSVINETYAGRATTIARTETMKAQLGSQLARYDAAGVGEVEAQDGQDDEECSARDGQTFTLDEAEDEMNNEHPNGTLSFLPVLSAGNEGDSGEGDEEA